MALETATYISDLVTTNPTSTDPKSQGDDHLRLIKTTLKNSFAGFPGMVIVTGSEAQGATVNDYTVTISPTPAAYTTPLLVVFKAAHANTGAATVQINALGTKSLLAVDGTALKTGDIESGGFIAAYYDGTSFYLVSGNDRANRNGETYSGTHDFSSSTISLGSGATATTPTTGDNSTKIATTAFVVQQAFLAALPAQTGNNGKFLTTDGSSASWATLAVGMNLLSTVTASNSAVVNIENTFDSSYDAYIIIASKVKPSSNNVLFRMRFKMGGSYLSTDYRFHGRKNTTSASAYTTGISQAATAITINDNGMNSTGISTLDLTLNINHPSDTSNQKQAYWSGVASDNVGDLTELGGAGRNDGTAALTGVQFFFSSGNIAQGTFRLYGIRSS